MTKFLVLIPIFFVCQLAHLVSSIWMLAAMLTGSHRAWKIAVGYDQLGNVAFGGDPDETISSRAARARRAGRRWGCVLCGLLDRFDQGHCERYLERRFVSK